MSEPDHDDPEVEARWCLDARDRISEYLGQVGGEYGQVGERPGWHVAPVVSIWAIESVARPGRVGWWAICGDLPTDIISSAGIDDPRAAMAAFAQRWADYAASCRTGRPPADFSVGDGSEALVELLERRARTLADWAEDDDIWKGPDANLEA